MIYNINLKCKNEDDIPYLTLDKDVEQQLIQNINAGWKNPYAFCDSNVQRREENVHDAATLTRPAFSRDVDKIINIPAYNRYSDKTQVFSFMDNDDICRRSLHVQLVSRISRTIGRILGLNTDLIEAIALGHDIGHTPFGHAGERFLNKYFNKHTGKYFNHNVQSVRVLDKLYRRNISLQVLDGVLCHNGEFEQQILRIGSTTDFQSFDNLVNSCEIEQQNISKLQPSTIEGCVVRVSDMIAYIGKDRSDAIEIGVLDSLDCFDSSIIGRSNAKIINNITIDIINNSYGKDHIEMSCDVYEDLKIAKKQNYDYIYLKEGIIDTAGNIVDEMFSEMYEKLLKDCKSGSESTPIYRHHIKKLAAMSNTLCVTDYQNEDPNDIVKDYIASMTDSYFMALYSHFFPNSDKDIISRGYCASLK